MKINTNQNNPNPNVPDGKTFIAANLIKTAVFIDKQGNEIDRKTGQIINKAEKE